MANLGLLATEVGPVVWGTPASFNGFRILAALLHDTLVGVSQTAALNRGRHLYSAGRPSRWALAHISSLQRSEIRCLPYFHTWCGLSANLECMSEMCCTRLAENTGRKKSSFRHHRTTLSGCIFAVKAYIDNRRKVFKLQYLPHMFLQYGELRATNG